MKKQNKIKVKLYEAGKFIGFTEIIENDEYYKKLMEIYGEIPKSVNFFKNK